MQPQIPHTSYLICATPRCGSSLLAEALKNTGIAGRPEEYFWQGDEVFWQERWGVSSYTDYLKAALGQGTTTNGVFGAKIMWGYFDDVVNKLRHIPLYSEKTAPDLLSAVFPNLHYIWITRRDKVRQAISHWKAIQTGVWTWSTDEPSVAAEEPAFNFEAIDSLIQEITKHESAWQGYFAACEVQPYTVIYEELVTAYEVTARDILQYLCISCPEYLKFAERQMKQQADAISEEWVQRYHSIKRTQQNLEAYMIKGIK